MNNRWVSAVTFREKDRKNVLELSCIDKILTKFIIELSIPSIRSSLLIFFTFQRYYYSIPSMVVFTAYLQLLETPAAYDTHGALHDIREISFHFDHGVHVVNQYKSAKYAGRTPYIEGR